MNLNTRSKTITLSPTEKGWLEEIKNLAVVVAAQTFAGSDAIKACDKLEKAIDDFKDAMLALAPVKKQKTLLDGDKA